MRLLSSIAISIAAGAASAAGVARYVAGNATEPAFWQHDPVAMLWLAAGGPVVIGLLVFALVAFIFVTGGMLRDIATARARLDWDGSDGHASEPAPQPNWVAAFEETAFAPIADQLIADEFRVAPLSLLRVLRVEIWRVYGKRLVCIEILAIAASAGVALVRPAWLQSPSATAGGSWEIAAALLLLAMVAAAWLLMDEAIGRMSGAVSRSSAAWPRPVATVDSPALLPPQRIGLDTGQNRIEHLLGAFERLIELLAARPDAAARVVAELALARTELRPLLERLDERLRPPPPPTDPVPAPPDTLARIAEELALARIELRPLLERLDERLRAPPAAPIEDQHDDSIWPQALAGITGALSDVARAMEKLSIEAAASRWDELEAALRTMGASLDGITATLQTQPPRPPGSRTVTDRLEALLDDISDRDFGDSHPPPRVASR